MDSKNSNKQKFSEVVIHGIEDLFQICRESKWEELTKLADTLSQARSKGLAVCSDCPTKRVRYGFRETFDMLVLESCPDLINYPRVGYSGLELLGLAAAPDGKYSLFSPNKYLPKDRNSGGSAKDDRKLETILRKTTKAFATSELLEDVLRKVSSISNYKRFVKDFIECHSKEDLKKYLAIKIAPLFKNMMKSLSSGLGNRDVCEEDWWNRAVFFMKPYIQILIEIKTQIDADTPLKKEQIDTLNSLMSYGRPFGHITHDDSGETYEVILMTNTRELGNYSIIRIWNHLVQPAYALARKLEQKHSKPRFRRQCRAPSCGKHFYTGRQNATNCPGSQGYKKNNCSLEWNRYKRYLRKISKDPKKNWDDDKLKQQFITYDKI